MPPTLLAITEHGNCPDCGGPLTMEIYKDFYKTHPRNAVVKQCSKCLWYEEVKKSGGRKVGC